MGCCLTNHNQHDAIIQNIIEQTVLEQEQIKIEEINSERIRTTLNSDQELNSDDGGKIELHVKKSSHHKRGFEKEENTNYLRKVDYNVKIKQIIVELIKNDNSQFYKISFCASYLDFDVMVDMKGVQVNGLQHNLQIYPLTYQEASRFAKYDCFFKADKYFNYEKKDSKKQFIFEKLLQVERHILQGHQKSASSQEKRVVNRRWGMIADMVNINQKTQNIQNRQQFKFNVVYELLEAIQVFDIEVNPRFLNILFHLMMQSYYPNLRESLVFIEDVYFLFQDLPHMDCPQFYKILIFYQGMNYSLKELHVHLEFESLNLSDLSLQKLSYCLFKILESCYSKYLYRLNFTLKNIYYFRRLKQFKLQSFQRISSLIPFQPNVQSSVDCVSDEKFALFKRSFVKDYMAICDIIILFKNPRGYNQKIISQLRKKKDKVQDYAFKEYLTYVDSLFDENKDKAILEFIKNGCNLSAVGAEFDFELSFKEFKRLCLQLEILIITAEQLKKKRKQDQERRQERMKQKMEEQLELQVTPTKQLSELSSDSDDDEKQQVLKDFDIEIVLDSSNILEDKKGKDQEMELLKKEMIYSSFLMNKNFTRNCQIYLRKQTEYSIQKVQAQIYLAQAKSQEIANEKERKQFFQELLEQAIELVEKNQNYSIETANFLVLVQLLQYSPRKPQCIILSLLKMFQLQQRNKFKLRRRIKKAIHSSTGLIEIRKQVILQLANVEHCLSNGQLNEANSAIFNLIDIQMKKNQANTLLFGYSLFVYGLICQETIQIQSAMITFEMCKQLYDNYFPMQKLVEVKAPQKIEEQKSQKKLTYQQQIQRLEEPKKATEYVLVNFQNMATYNLSIMAYKQGVVFCQLNDPENALKALQKAIEYRKVIHEEFSDEVIEIVLQMLKIYIENEESSQVIKLAWFYARKINLLYKTNQLQCLQNKNFAKFLFILAGIFQSCNTCFSALRFYSRASRAFTLSKTQTFNRIYFIQKQRKQILSQIKDFNPNAFQESQESYFQTKVKSVYDKLKPFFEQVYFVNSLLSMDSSLNFSIGGRLLYANAFFKNSNHEQALERYLEIHKNYQSIQKDECYGYNIEKIGLSYIESKQFDKAKQQFQFAIGIYERYLFFPFKEYCIMRCNLQIIAILAMQKQTENLIKYFNQVDNFIHDCQQFMNWSIIQEERKYNKFQLISKKAGIKILYQLVDLLDLIDKFRNVRKRWYKKINDTEYLAQRGEKMQKRLTYRKKEKKLMGEYRKWCLTGKEIKIKIRKGTNNQQEIPQNEQNDQSDEVVEQIQTKEEKQEPPRKSKFFLIDETQLKKQKKQTKKEIEQNTQEIQQDTLTKFKDIACSTIETQVTQNVQKKEKQPMNKTPSQRSKSSYKKPLNPFQKVSKKQM